MKKAILIDVHNRTITEVNVLEDKSGSQLSSIYEHLKCSIFECVNIGKNDIYVDEEGILDVTPDTKFFFYKGTHQPLSGNGLIMGFDDETGESVDTTLTIDEVKSNVKFMTATEVALSVRMGVLGPLYTFPE